MSDNEIDLLDIPERDIDWSSSRAGRPPSQPCTPPGGRGGCVRKESGPRAWTHRPGPEPGHSRTKHPMGTQSTGERASGPSPGTWSDFHDLPASGGDGEPDPGDGRHETPRTHST